MKKTWLGLLLIGLFTLAGTSTHAATCKQVNFSNGKVCVDITKDSTNYFKLKTTTQNGYGSLRCAILLSDNTYREISSCNGGFYVGNTKEQLIKLYIKFGGEYPYSRTDKPSETNQWLFPQWMYDFKNGERSDSSIVDDDYNYSNSDVDNFSITSDDYYPTTNQRVDLRIKARNYKNSILTNYRGKVKFNVYYRSSSSSSWTKTTSSTYYELNSSYNSTYTFKYADNGDVILSDLIKFKKNYDYKVEVLDDDNDVSNYVIFDVTGNGSSSSSSDVDNFYLTTDDTTPSTNQRLDLTIKARDNDGSTLTNYRGTVRFNVYYRTSSSSSWTKTTSSTYYELDSDYDDGYTFSYGNNGTVTLYDVIRFKKSYYYKVEIVDDNNNSVLGYKLFDVGGSSSSSSNYDIDNFYLTTDSTAPSTNQRIDLTIKARDNNGSTVTDYRGTVRFNVYYRTSSSSSWTKTTSSTYYELDSDYDDGYTFSYGNNGTVTLYDVIRFKKSYYYKVEIVDDDDDSILGYKLFDVGGSSSSSSNYDINDFYITTDDSTPDTYQRVDLNVKARDEDGYTLTSYRGKVRFNIYYRTSTSSAWTKTTSSSYYELDSDYSNGYTFSSYDYGSITLSDAIRFKKSYYYKVEIVDDDDNNIIGYKLFDVGGSSTSSDSSSVAGFSSSELTSIRNLYNSRDQLIQSYKDNYSRLRNSSTWLDLSSSLKTEMSRILNDSSLKRYDNYSEFQDALEYRYDYTLSIK